MTETAGKGNCLVPRHQGWLSVGTVTPFLLIQGFVPGLLDPACGIRYQEKPNGPQR
ncbi:protein of unknown function [Pseudomonas inefficax]|uniref:Uncharacterized protein n=1 Tax=Pseudomonas inefficax TaxID=2078786 RepID=A0AAQ1PBZ9_9PSED|nr:protein of unknown function [Pseudomonas inefficax]